MNIGLDFDGVISNCGRLKSDGAKELFGVDIPPSRFKKELVVGEGLLTAEQYRKLQWQIYSTRELGLRMEPVEGALLYLPQLLREGHDVLVITSRGDAEVAIAREWSMLFGLDLRFVGVGYDRDKSEAAADRDLYVDDDLDKLEPLVGVVDHRFLFSWGYNQHIDVGSVASRVGSWEDLYDAIQRLQDAR